jgi:adenine-specific DNA-methyltransferase
VKPAGYILCNNLLENTVTKKPKLELTWIGKEHRPRLEPRILLEEADKSYHAAHRVTDRDLFDNRLIHGDNLLALKALEQDFAGKVKCIYIDPPYNTGSAFEHYDDGVEHSLWLSLIRDRLEILKLLLSSDGAVWINIDDNEAHYLKVLLDEVFGRKNFVANVLWQKRTSPDARIQLGASHDHILVYAKDKAAATFNKLKLSPEQASQYRNPDDDARGPWASTDFTAQGWRPNQMYQITTPSGTVYDPPDGRCWSNIESEYKKLVADKRLWFGRDGTGFQNTSDARYRKGFSGVSRSLRRRTALRIVLKRSRRSCDHSMRPGVVLPASSRSSTARRSAGLWGRSWRSCPVPITPTFRS